MADAATETTVREILTRLGDLEGPLLPILHAVQAEFGYIPTETLPIIAAHLNITRAEVHGVVTFYHDFRDAPAGRHVVRICRAEACQSVGGNAISNRAFEKLEVGWHGTSSDGKVTIEPVYCLGLCACGPAAMVDGRVVGRMTEAKLDRILEEVGA